MHSVFQIFRFVFVPRVLWFPLELSQILQTISSKVCTSEHISKIQLDRQSDGSRVHAESLKSDDHRSLALLPELNISVEQDKEPVVAHQGRGWEIDSFTYSRRSGLLYF